MLCVNIKYVLKNSFDEIVYCVINGEKEEFEKVLSIEKGRALSVDCYSESVKLTDYYVGETRAIYYILNKEETRNKLQYFLKRI